MSLTIHIPNCSNLRANFKGGSNNWNASRLPKLRSEWSLGCSLHLPPLNPSLKLGLHSTARRVICVNQFWFRDIILESSNISGCIFGKFQTLLHISVDTPISYRKTSQKAPSSNNTQQQDLQVNFHQHIFITSFSSKIVENSSKYQQKIRGTSFCANVIFVWRLHQVLGVVV